MSAEANTPEKNLREYLDRVAMQGVLFVLNLPENDLTRWLVERLFGRLLGNVIDLAVTFDEKIGAEGLQAACKFVALRCGTPAQVRGVAHLPTEGPLVLASNHPGMFDAMAIIAELPRRDVCVVVGGVPYLNEMPNASQHIFYTDHSPRQSVRVVRECVRHLRAGGCVLIFPTGLADPDPDYMEGAHARIERWSESVALMLRQAPEARLVTVTASGILSPRFLNHPIARIQPKVRYRQRVAEFFQLYRQFRRVDTPPLAQPRVSFGAPVSLPELVAEAGSKKIMPAVIDRSQADLAGHMAWRPGG